MMPRASSYSAPLFASAFLMLLGTPAAAQDSGEAKIPAAAPAQKVSVQEPAPTPTTVAAASAKVAPTLPSLGGTWAQLQVQSSVSRVPVLGNVVSETVSVLRTEVRQAGSKLTLVSRVCDIAIESEVDAVETIVPESMWKAMGVMQLDAFLKPGKGAWTFRQPPTVSVLGAKLKKPWTDKLPTWSRDYRVKDVDKDGNPGVTVNVRGMIDGSIYLVQRSWTELTGTLENDDAISGTIRWNTDQSILGATSALLESGPDARPNPDRQKSFFRMRRIPASMSCADIVQKRRALLDH